jgi:DegV family protein with EDD domain
MVRVVTDSTADIPAALAEELGITMIPALVTFGRETFRDGVDLSREDFYARLASSRELPSTAAPSIAVYEEVYERLAGETDEIFSIHLAANLSALHNVARLAAEVVTQRRPQVRITVMDSQQVSMGYGWLAIAAAEAAQQGDDLDSILAQIEVLRPQSRVLAALDTLDYVHRGGRVGWVQAFVGSLLRIKPVVEVYDGEVLLLERIRSRQRSLHRLLDLVVERGPVARAVVLHANAPDLAEQFADRLQQAFPTWTRQVSEAGVTISTHAGPGAIGVAYLPQAA